MLRKWEKLPENIRTEAVRPYYEKLKKKKFSLLCKRIFDVFVSSILIVILLPMMIIWSTVIAVDSRGGVFFRQERVTQYGRTFKILKFRTMVANAEELGTQVTVKNDMRVTRVGAALRKYRIDELPQLINVLVGDMSFVGTRPETTKYVKRYTPEMMATLLLPAGVTSEASIKYKDEKKFLENAGTVNEIDDLYIEKVLPGKMEYNLKGLEKYSFFGDILIMIRTVFAVTK